MKSYLELFSPAKVNLFFKVLFKRNDGYHEIASLFQAINLGDSFSIKLSKKDKFRCDNFALGFDNSNLIFRAIESFKRKTNLSFYVDIILDKKIPVQAGLGGGSGNAATALFGINELLSRPLSYDQLIDLGKEIGSDVTFFFSSGAAFCSGRGEIFKDVPSKKISLYLALPNFGVSTVSVYKNVDVKMLDNVDLEKSMESFYKGDFLFFNDLEIAAFSVEPRLLDIKYRLKKLGFDKVVMTGSGSAFMCFGEVENLPAGDIRFFKIENIQRNSNSWYPYSLLS
jgi:4-diphosphocytidyl-2-C-methyl-D-erythritol kinase